MKVDIVLVSGKAGAGKDETFKQLRDFVAAKHDSEDWVVIQHFFARPIREITDDIRMFMNDHGIDTPPEVLVKDGDLMQLIGAWARKRYGADVWLKILKAKIKSAEKTWLGGTKRLTIVVTDCRFRNEFEAFPEALRVRLEASEEVRRARAEMWRENTMHESEIDLDEYAKLGRFDAFFQTDAIVARAVAENIYINLIHEDWMKIRYAIGIEKNA